MGLLLESAWVSEKYKDLQNNRFLWYLCWVVAYFNWYLVNLEDCFKSQTWFPDYLIGMCNSKCIHKRGID